MSTDMIRDTIMECLSLHDKLGLVEREEKDRLWCRNWEIYGMSDADKIKLGIRLIKSEPFLFFFYRTIHPCATAVARDNFLKVFWGEEWQKKSFDDFLDASRSEEMEKRSEDELVALADASYEFANAIIVDWLDLIRSTMTSIGDLVSGYDYLGDYVSELFKI